MPTSQSLITRFGRSFRRFQRGLCSVTTAASPASKGPSEPLPKELLTPTLASRLTKAGYGLVGSHAAVKVCRWTKKQLQGRGGCYKHTFYGIESHRCMETTTFLACANRCVFCWRHHTHPVSHDFSRWKADPPEALLTEALAQFQKLIKPLKGMPGVTLERYNEALVPRHCALSLVGEPVVYPYINEFVNLLHRKRISSFLVTNGQHPEAIEKLTEPVTQLYVSVDAPDPETLKKIGRPLFKDYWDRLLQSLHFLSKRSERTVLRLTLVNNWNDFDLEGYAALVKRAQPDFIEIKAFTYPGPTPSIQEAGLSVKNCASGTHVVRFSKQLCETLQTGTPQDGNRQWELASLHMPSNAALLAASDFAGVSPSEGVEDSALPKPWNCWIDFDAFHSLRAQTPSRPLDPVDAGQKTAVSETASTSCREGEPNALFQLRLASRYFTRSPAWTHPASALGGFDPQFDVPRWEKQREGRREYA